jgi:flagellar biosynthesis/type III secretory pathway protein FliH
LEIFGKLRNLQLIIAKTLETMGLQYDLKTDLRFLQGKELGLQEGLQKGLQEGEQKGLQKGKQEGLQEGLQKGKQEGKQEAALAIARNAIASGANDEFIAKITRLSLEQVQALRRELQTPPNGE